MTLIPDSKRRTARTGAATVEFALTASILFMFLFAGIEFTRVNTITNSLDNAVYEGARHAILPGSTPAEVQAIVSDYLASVGIKIESVNITPTDLNSGSEYIRVTGTVNLNDNSWGVSQWVPTKSITKECELTRELK